MRETRQEIAFFEVDNLLKNNNFQQVIHKMMLWQRAWLAHFHLLYPEQDEILTKPPFAEFWEQKKGSVSGDFIFAKQKQLSDRELVMGYIFYLMSIKAEEKPNNPDQMLYLQKAVNFNSIHAAQTMFHKLLMKKTPDKFKKMETLEAILFNWECFANKWGTPGYLLIANGYLHLLKLNDSPQTEKYQLASFTLWKYLHLAKLTQPQSTAAIHNAYFGQGLALSNAFNLKTIEAIQIYCSTFIQDQAIKVKAEQAAAASLSKLCPASKLGIWMKNRNKSEENDPDKPQPGPHKLR